MRRFVVVTALTVALLPPPVMSQSRSSLAGRLDAYVAPLVARHDFAGVILVGRGDRVIAQRAWGAANIELGVPNSVNTRFPIASLSKQFTAAAVMTLANEGRLRFSDTLATYMPDLPWARRTTLHQLLNHTAGLPNVFPRYESGTDSLIGRAARERWLASIELPGEPGTAYAYSNVGYSVLADLIGRLTGTSFVTSMRERVFTVAGLRETESASGRNVMRAAATGYEPGDGADWLAHPVAEDADLLQGAGGLVSSASDLFRWCRALHAGKVVPDSLLQKMISQGYGLVSRKRNHRRVVEHDGELRGFVSSLQYFPDDGITIVVLGNIQGSLLLLQEAVPALVFGETPPVAPVYMRHAAPPADSLARFAGVYRVTSTLNITVRPDGGALVLAGSGGTYTPLVPLGANRFFYRARSAELRFASDTLHWSQGSGTFPLPRIGR